MSDLTKIVAVDCLALIASYLCYDQFTVFTTRCVGKSLRAHRAFTLEACYSRSTHLNSREIDRSWKVRNKLWRLAISRWNELFLNVKQVRVMYWGVDECPPITNFVGTLIVGGDSKAAQKTMRLFPNASILQIQLGCNCKWCSVSNYLLAIFQSLSRVKRVENEPSLHEPVLGSCCSAILGNTTRWISHATKRFNAPTLSTHSSDAGCEFKFPATPVSRARTDRRLVVYRAEIMRRRVAFQVADYKQLGRIRRDRKLSSS